MQDQFTARGHFPTAHASRYLQQLCKHFAHKIEVRYDAETGDVALPSGPCKMYADGTELTVEVCSDSAEGIARAKRIIDSHLERFAFREGFTAMDWAG